MVVAQTETTKAKRGTGPMQLSYVDSKGSHEHKRVPIDAAGIRIVAGGKPKNYDATKLPAAVKDALVVFALASRIKTQVANHAEDNGANVHELADGVYSDFLAGKIYSKAEGGAPRGKKFDAHIYAEALKAMYAFCAKKGLKSKSGKAIVALTDAQVADFTTQLESMTPKERTEKIKGLNANSIYKKALAELKTKAIEVEAEVMDDMPF